MPAVGQQHEDHGRNLSGVISRPFSEREARDISERLERKLGPEFISQRLGNGGKQVPYLSADKAISLANEVFSFRGWSSSIQQVQVDYVDENANTGKVSLGLSVIVRVTLKDGTFHEDIGYGSIENCKSKAAAFEKAKKEGTTDGLKRALRNFGNVLGNCVYDKEYCAKVTRMKVAPVKWDPDSLHRHQDHVLIKKEPVADGFNDQAIGTLNHAQPQFRQQKSLEDEFSDDFNECDLAVPEGDDGDAETLRDDRHLSLNRNEPQTPSAAPARVQHMKPVNPSTNSTLQQPSHVPMDTKQAPITKASEKPTLFRSSDSSMTTSERDEEALKRQVAEKREQAIRRRNEQQEAQSIIRKQLEAPAPDPPVGFFTARAAETIQSNQGNLPNPAATFNPHSESPSIRKTAGVDHSKTKPVNRDTVSAPAVPAPSPTTRSNTTNFVNPQADRNRKLGMPTTASPLSNRGSYRPPQQVKRQADGRPALNEVNANSVNVGGTDGTVDAKRQKLETESGVETSAVT